MAIVDRLIDFENGDLEFDDSVSLFQELVDTGMAWKLQGFYGRIATELIEQGLVTVTVPGVTFEDGPFENGDGTYTMYPPHTVSD